MSRYTAVSSTPASPRQSSSGRASLHSSRRPSISSFRFSRRQESRIPDPDEMDAAFDAPPDADEDENSGLLAREANNRDAERILDRIPGDYDFDRTYVSLCIFYIYSRIVLISSPTCLLHSRTTRHTIPHRGIRMVYSHKILSGHLFNPVISLVVSYHLLSFPDKPPSIRAVE